ncbi:MAG: MG2 domain-containing protein, partial [Bacteroidota bacterium]
GEQQQVDKDQEFLIRVKKGLRCMASSRALTEDRDYAVALDALTKLAVTSVASGFDGTKGWIEVFTTQQVDPKAVERYVSVEPRRKFRTSVTQHSFKLEAAFDPGSMVDVIVKKGLPGLYGGKLAEGYSQTVVMADLQPKLRFTDKKGQYLMRGGLENVKLEAVNVRRADVRVWEVFENNLVFYLSQTRGGYYSDHCCGVNNLANYGPWRGRGGRLYASTGTYEEDDYYDYDYDYDYGYSRSGDPGNYGKLIHQDSVILSDDKNRIQDFTLNMGQHLQNRYRGIYVVEVRDYRDYWRRDLKPISISDLGMIAKRGENELMVFVNSIASTQPVADAEVRLISTNNQTLMTGKTDARGVAHFKDIAGKIEGFSPRLITVRKGEDFNFLDFRDHEIGLSRYDVQGKVEYSSTYDTYIYGDRNLFRPGETAHFNAIVRTKALESVSDIPLLFKVISPRGKTFLESRKTLGEEGGAELAVDFPTYAETGDYVLEAYSGSNQLLATYAFSVEEFVPDKIRVEAATDKSEIRIGQDVDINVFSEYLFGAPCSDHALEVDVNLRHAPFRSEQYANYHFNPYKFQNSRLNNELIEGTLDATGRKTSTWKAPTDIQAGGIIRATAYATVFDATGRTVTRAAPFTLYPNDHYVGIRESAYYFATGDAVPVSFMAVDYQDKALSNFPIEVEVLRHEWRTVLKKNENSGQFYYQSERALVSEAKKTLTVNGHPVSWSYRPQRSGRFEFRVRKPGEERFTSRTFHAYGRSSTTTTSFEVDREGRIEIVPDKEVYAPGDRAKLLFKAPFSGKMLVTLERDKVLEYHYLNVQNNSAELDVTITDAHLPNMFVSATLFKAHTVEKTTPFLVGHGFQPIRVEQKSNRLEVDIRAPEQIKPRRTQEIVVKTNPRENIHVTLALVDEGILQIKNFETPDPYEWMYANRKLSVSSYDMYEQLLDEMVSVGASMAGGDENSSQKRVNPITSKRFKLLSFWSGTRR